MIFFRSSTPCRFSKESLSAVSDPNQESDWSNQVEAYPWTSPPLTPHGLLAAHLEQWLTGGGTMYDKYFKTQICICSEESFTHILCLCTNCPIMLMSHPCFVAMWLGPHCERITIFHHPSYIIYVKLPIKLGSDYCTASNSVSSITEGPHCSMENSGQIYRIHATCAVDPT